jgi:F0F1-type ATP synthase delta subunit
MNKQTKIKLYAKALVESLLAKGADEKKVISNFAKLLIKAGLERKSKEILELAEELLLIKQGKRKIVFETARKMNDSQRKLLESFVKKGDIVQEKIKPELIAGVKIMINGSQQFDSSMQSKLRNITQG